MHLHKLLLNTLFVALLPISVTHADEVPLGKKYIVFGTIPHSGRINPLHTLATELASRGHDTAFFTMERGQYTSKEQADKNVQFVSLGNYSSVCNEEDMLSIESSASKRRGFLHTIAHIIFNGQIMGKVRNCLLPAYNETIMKMHQTFRQKRPDLCVVDFMSLANFDACVSFNIPTVIMRPGFLLGSMNYIPPTMSGASIHSTFWQRFTWDLKQHILHFWVGGPYPISIFMGKNRVDYFGPNYAIPDIETCCVNIVTTVFGIEYAQETSPLNFLVGPLLKDEKSIESYAAQDPRCSEMDSWLEANPRVVFANFGTTGLLTKKTFEAMLGGFEMLHNDKEFEGHKVLWRISKNQQKLLLDVNTTLPSYIRVESWLCSQQHVMAHPSVKLFISHGGANSPNEALVNGKPMIVIPCFSDQFDMANRLKDVGVAEIFKRGFAASEFASALTTMLQNHASYVLRVKQLSPLLKKAGGRQRAAGLIEEIIAQGGYEHLIPYSVKHMTYIQRKGLDILAGYIVIALACAGVAVILVKRIERWVWGEVMGRMDTKVAKQKKMQ